MQFTQLKMPSSRLHTQDHISRAHHSCQRIQVFSIHSRWWCGEKIKRHEDEAHLTRLYGLIWSQTGIVVRRITYVVPIRFATSGMVTLQYRQPLIPNDETIHRHPCHDSQRIRNGDVWKFSLSTKLTQINAVLSLTTSTQAYIWIQDEATPRGSHPQSRSCQNHLRSFSSFDRFPIFERNRARSNRRD